MISLPQRVLLVGLNYWAFFQTLLAVLLLFYCPESPLYLRISASLFVLYLLPPLLCRLILLVFGPPPRKSKQWSKPFFVWWATAQFQVLYLRLPFLEELLRIVPGLYSIWLRLWGAKIGRFVYWSPQVKIMDRPFLEIGDDVMVGYGAAFTSHHVNRSEKGELELVFGIPKVGNRVILGGLSGLAPGAEVAEDEMLPSTMGLAPYYLWQGGRRYARPTPPSS